MPPYKEALTVLSKNAVPMFVIDRPTLRLRRRLKWKSIVGSVKIAIRQHIGTQRPLIVQVATNAVQRQHVTSLTHIREVSPIQYRVRTMHSRLALHRHTHFLYDIGACRRLAIYREMHCLTTKRKGTEMPKIRELIPTDVIRHIDMLQITILRKQLLLPRKVSSQTNQIDNHFGAICNLEVPHVDIDIGLSMNITSAGA